MRILFLSWYNHPTYHRKVELLADAPDVELLHIIHQNSGIAPGAHRSANGQRTYHAHLIPRRQLGRPGDPHRMIYLAAGFHLRRFRPDLIHVDDEQESLISAQIALARNLWAPRTPLILFSWQNLLRRRSLAVRLVCAFTLRSAQYILCGNREAVDVLRQQGYRAGARVLPMIGLDTRYFYPLPPERIQALRRELGLTGVVAGYFGRRIPEKGVDTLIEAAARCRTPVQLLIGGSGPQTQALKALADRLGIAGRCRFLDGVAYEELVQYLNLQDMQVVASRTTPVWKEQLGRVILDAMGCKVPVIGSNSGAIPEVIGDAGRIFPEGDSAALAAILDELAEQPGLRRELAERGYRRATEVYSIERLAEQTLSVWRELCAEHGAQTASRRRMDAAA